MPYIFNTRLRITNIQIMTTNTHLVETREHYIDALTRGEPGLARSVITNAVNNGVTTPEIYLSVLAPAQVKLGELWHQGVINIAQEHLATGITMQMMDIQRQAASPRPPLGLRAVVMPVEGDQHFVGARMMADLLILDGWDVDFFWNATPAYDLAEYLEKRRVNLLALSATMPEFLNNVRDTVDIIEELMPQRPKIVLGGSAFNVHSPDAENLGVDAIITEVANAAIQVRELVGHTTEKPTLEQQLAAIGENIREARKDRNLTQQQLATSAGLDRTYISLVEHGRQNLTIAAMLKISEALDISIQDLLDPTH